MKVNFSTAKPVYFKSKIKQNKNNVNSNNDIYKNNYNNYLTNPYNNANLRYRDLIGTSNFSDAVMNFLEAGRLIACIIGANALYAGALYVIFGIGEYVADTLPEKIEEQRKAEIEEAIRREESYVEEIAKSLNITKEQAQQYHDKFLISALIKPTYDGKEKGINAIRGYGYEKYELAMNVIAPIINAQKTDLKEYRDKVPNGLLLYGPAGSGKTYIASCLCEHLSEFGVKVVDVELDSSDHEQNVDEIRRVFNDAYDRFCATGKYTIIRFPEDIDRIFYPSRRNESYLSEMGTFLYRAEDCAKKGAIWVATANNASNIDKAVLRRATERMAIGDMEDFAVADMIKYTLIKNGQKDSSDNFDYMDVINYVKETDITPTPFEYEVFVKRAINAKSPYEPYVTSKMVKEQIKAFNEFEYSIDEETKKEFEEDKEIVNSTPNDGKDDLEKGILGFDLNNCDNISEEEMDKLMEIPTFQEIDRAVLEKQVKDLNKLFSGTGYSARINEEKQCAEIIAPPPADNNKQENVENTDEKPKEEN